MNGIHHVLMNPEAYGLIKQKPAEWSEDDEKQIRQIERIIKDAGCSKTLQAKIHNWLKSLRPDTFQNGNSRWKPSEEQMEMLSYVIENRDDHCGDVLCSLYADLKKL